MAQASLVIQDPERVEQIREMYHGGESDPDFPYEFVTREFLEEWRWGNRYMLVIRDRFTSQLWGTTVQEQSGDNYYLSLDEEDEVCFYPVEAVEKVEYQRVKEVK